MHCLLREALHSSSYMYIWEGRESSKHVLSVLPPAKESPDILQLQTEKVVPRWLKTHKALQSASLSNKNKHPHCSSLLFSKTSFQAFRSNHTGKAKGIASGHNCGHSSCTNPINLWNISLFPPAL